MNALDERSLIQNAMQKQYIVENDLNIYKHNVMNLKPFACKLNGHYFNMKIIESAGVVNSS